MNIIGVIQARLGSTRLPGKVMMPLLGKPMLTHVVERAKRAINLTGLYVVCPLQDIGPISKVVKCGVFADGRVAEDDVMGRINSLVESNSPDMVVRICADNPCVDPANIDSLIQSYLGEQLWNYLGTNLGDLSKSATQFEISDEGDKWPQGLGAEIYSGPLVMWMQDNLHQKEEREHPHSYFHRHGKVFVPDCQIEWKPPLRFTVDTQEDFDEMTALYEHFGHNYFSSEEAVNYLQEDTLRCPPKLKS